MKRTQAQERIHTLIIPLVDFALLVPSALVAEVVHASELVPMPCSEKWLMGMLSWRARPVPVISFDALLGADLVSNTSQSKIVIFYPLSKRKAWDFFGVLTSGEPQPQTFADANELNNTVESASPYLATTIKLERGNVGIPAMDVLHKVFYPDGV